MEAETKQSSQTTESFDVYKWMAWLHANLKAVVGGLVVVVVVATAIALYSWKQGQNEAEANAQLFTLPSANVANKTAKPTAEALLKIADAYPSTSAGQQSLLLAGQVDFSNGKYDVAQQLFTRFLSEHGSSPLAAQAAIGVAASLEAQGKTAEAIQKYQDAITRYPEAGIAAPAKLTLARLFEEQNKPDQALKNYDDLLRTPNPYDPWAAEAAERRDVLLSKHPELNKAPAASIVPAAPVAPAAAPVAKPAAPAATAPAKNAAQPK